MRRMRTTALPPSAVVPVVRVGASTVPETALVLAVPLTEPPVLLT